MFMLPLMVGSAIGGPLAGLLLGALGLRVVACTSLLVSAASLAGLANSNFAQSGIEVVLMLAALGLALGTGLTASSVAIMGSTPPEKAGSAGALEATSYDLGTGLGITCFGLLLTSSYEKAITLPTDMPATLAVMARQSIGETLMAAQTLAGPRGQALEEAGRQAFSASHSTVLLAAAVMISILSMIVFFALRRYRDHATWQDDSARS